MDNGESSKYTKLLLDSSPIAAHFWDEELHIIDCNQAAVKLFNLSSKQEYIEKYFDLTPEFQPDGVRSIDKLKHLISKAHETGRQKVEWMRQSINGEPIPFELTLVRVECQDKNLIAGYCRDLREHRRMTEDIERRDTLLDAMNRIAVLLLAAANSENFEESLLKGMEIIGQCLDADFVRIWPNETHDGVLHFTLKYRWLSETGKKAPSVDVGTALPYSERWKELFYRGECVNGPVSTLPQEDQDLLAPLGITSIVTVPLFYQDEFWGVFCVDDCAKERHFAEGEINLLYTAGLMLVNAINRNLQAVETSLQLARLNLVVQAARIGLWDVEIIKEDPNDPDNAFMWSDEFRHMLGFKDENDFPNTSISWSNRIHADDEAEVFDAFTKHLMDKTGKTPYKIEYRMQKKDGEYGYYHDVGETIRDKDGNAVRVAGALLDITETKNLLCDLETEKEAAQNANNAKTTFLANMSHEIRTPMNAILGMSEILEQEDLEGRQMSYVKDINTAAHSLLDIINDILDMSKIEAGKLELHPVDYNLNQFIDNIVSMFTHVANNKGLDFLVEIIGEVPDYLFGDDIRLRQVLTNLCGNAVKFTAEGSVRLSVEADGGKLIMKIEDTGPGIKKEDIPTLFNAFEQADKAKNRSVMGTGLGLPICKSFIGMMGGEIFVESIYGSGTVFTVTLPIIKGNPENIQNVEIAYEEESIFAPDAKVLITDDNEFNLRVAYGLLNLMDIESEMVDSGAKAIEFVKHNNYDIVFMDHMMPEMNGIEAVQAIRKLGGKYKSLVIIALTANAVAGAKEMFCSNGFDDFLAKPIDTGELREVLKKHLPPEKIRKDSSNKNRQANIDKMDEIRWKSIVSFVKDNQNTFKSITESLTAGDINTAFRIAHTLKSIAGYLGKKRLQQAAYSLEHSLKNGIAGHTIKQLENLERELSFALREFERMVNEMESKKPELVKINADEMADLINEIVPLLENDDFSATDYVEKLQGIVGMEKVAEMIENYDFTGALQLIRRL